MTQLPAKAPFLERLPVSAIVLIAANLAPLVGVLAFKWSILFILVLYWAENVVVGAFNVLRMACARGKGSALSAKLGLIPFFIFHYGMFTLVHGVFVSSFFGASRDFPDLLADLRSIGWAGVFLVVSHGFSFVYNYILGGEFRRASLPELMARPYARVFVLHATILGGGVAAAAFGEPLSALLLLIALKTMIDTVAHLRHLRKVEAAA